MDLSTWHLRKGLGLTGEGWQEEKIPDLRCALHYKAVGSSSPARSAQPCALPGAVSHLLTLHLTVWGLSSLSLQGKLLMKRKMFLC